MTLEALLPSLARAAVGRSFDPRFWPDGAVLSGREVRLAGRSCTELLANGPRRTGNVVLTRVTRLVRSGPIVVCDVEGCGPVGAVLLDAAWPGTALAGARMRELLVRFPNGGRLAAHVEVPVGAAAGAPLALAVRGGRAAHTDESSARLAGTG